MKYPNRRIFVIVFCLLLVMFVGCTNQLSIQSPTPLPTSTASVSANSNSTLTPSTTESYPVGSTPGKRLTISYIDVGQADSILIQTPNGSNMLIDAGEAATQEALASYLTSKGVHNIDVLVATHPHADHIGGMAYIIKHFTIGSIYMPKATTTTATYEDLLYTIQSKELIINTAKAGVVIDLDSDLTVKMLAPNSASYDNLNDYSAVIKMTYQRTSFLFMGDTSSVSEKEMLKNEKADLKADILKVGHHGSSTSSTATFLAAVAPKHAIISVGKDNTYGHPAQATLDRLKKVNALIYRTDQDGTIIVISDGQTITVMTSK